MKKVIAFLLTSLLVLVTLAGCGGKASPAAMKEDSAAPDGKSASANQAAEPAGSVYGKYLTVDQLQDISGLTGLKVSEEGVTLRFTDGSDAVVYEARFYGSDFYEDEVEANRDYYTDVPDVGEKAAICIPDSPYRLVFVKGNRCVMTQTLSKNAEGEWVLSEEQLISIAKSIASKLPD